MKRIDICILLFAFTFWGCSSTPQKRQVKIEETTLKEFPDTRKMIDALNRIYRNAPAQAYYTQNIRNSEDFKRQIDQTVDNNEKVNLYFKYAKELINAGKTREGLTVIQDILRAVGAEGAAITSFTMPLYDLQAIAYMRMGEQDNCIVHHTGSSCIIPFDVHGLHQDKTGSTYAMDIYTRMLQKFPDNLEAQWLLNVACMTLGVYPEGVPSEFRVAKEAFTSHGLVPKFENIASQLGIDADGHAGGSCVDDFNGDGFLDIVASGMGFGDQIRYYTNNGDGSFTDKTSEAGLDGLKGGLNINHADYNNDGFPDVLVLRGGWFEKFGNHPNSLLRNNGNGTFEDVTVASGLYSEHPTQTASWTDFNLDGYLDLFIGNESDSVAGYTNACELYMNRGDGTFANIAGQLGLDLIAYVKGCAWGDVDNNGYPDLFVSVLTGANKLYMNRGGSGPDDWKFEERGAESGVDEPHYSFPTWFFDYNNDGWEDLFVCGYDLTRFNSAAEDEMRALKGMKPLAELPRLFRNNGDGSFTDVTRGAGISRVMYGMGANFGDINNDGYLDFYVGTGAPNLRTIVPNKMFLNSAGKSFVDVTSEGGFGHIQKGHGVSFGDLDNDGDLDMYCVIGGAYEGDNFRNALFNNPGNDNHWIVLKLIGKTSNRDAIGAAVRVDVNENGRKRSIFRTVSTGGSFGASSLQLEIGLGGAAAIDVLEVKWPDSKHSVQKFTNVEIGKKYLMYQGDSLKPVEYIPIQWSLKNPMHSQQP